MFRDDFLGGWPFSLGADLHLLVKMTQLSKHDQSFFSPELIILVTKIPRNILPEILFPYRSIQEVGFVSLDRAGARGTWGPPRLGHGGHCLHIGEFYFH